MYSAGNVRPRYSLTRSYVGRIVIPFLLLLVNGNHQDVIIPLSLLLVGGGGDDDGYEMLAKYSAQSVLLASFQREEKSQQESIL